MNKILIVDDDRHFIQRIRTLLTGFGYASDFVTNSQHLFPRLELETIDLVLLDINMPGTDGVAILKQLKVHPIHQTIPVIMLTAELDEQVLADCFEYGATDFISKPVRELILKARVESALAMRSHIQALEDRTTALDQANKKLQQEIAALKQADEK